MKSIHFHYVHKDLPIVANLMVALSSSKDLITYSWLLQETEISKLPSKLASITPYLLGVLWLSF